MLAQYIRDKVAHETGKNILSRLISRKFNLQPENLTPQLESLNNEDFLALSDRILEYDSFEDIKIWINQKKRKKLDV